MGSLWAAVLVCVLGALVTQGQAAAVSSTTPSFVVSKGDGPVTGTDTPIEGSTEDKKVEESPTTEGPLPPIKLTSLDVNSVVRMRYAHTAVVTTVRNPATRSQEATIRIIIPDTAFITGLVMTLSDKSYKAYVKEKEEAKQIYSDAVSQGIGAAHVAAKARDSNHFTVTVNVEPNTTAKFNLTYEELLVRRIGVYNHAINLHPGGVVPKMKVTVRIQESAKITELRVPEVKTGNEIDATENDAQNSKAVIERGHDDREATITFEPDLLEQRRLMDIYAEKSKERHAQFVSQGWVYGQPEQQAVVDGVLGQFVVQYDVDRPNDGQILVNDGYFVHFFAPSDLPPLSKHVVFVLDTSGSMMDRKITQLRDAMQTILSELNPGDYFNIVEFASSVNVYDLKQAEEAPRKAPNNYFWHEERPVTLVPPARATPDNVAKAKVIVTQLTANGGTNIAGALNVAADLVQKGVGWSPEPAPEAPTAVTVSNEAPNEAPHGAPAVDSAITPATSATSSTTSTTAKTTDVADDKDDKRPEPIIIFLTDGDPTVGETDPTRIINRITEKNSGPNRAAIFCLAFGEDADRKFLRKLSLRNDGFMRHIYEAADAALQLHDFYRQVASPLLAHLEFQYPPEQIKEGSVTKNKFRMLYSGSETVVAGRVADEAVELAPHVVGVCGVDDTFLKKKYEIFPKVPVQRNKDAVYPLERLWAYLTVKQLLDQRDAQDGLLVSENNLEDSPEKRALKIALKYEFVTPLTSLVVVKPNATNNALEIDSADRPEFQPAGIHGIAPPAGAQPMYDSFAARPPSLPHFSYKAAFSSTIGHVQPLAISGSHPSAALFGNVQYEELSEDYSDGASWAPSTPFTTSSTTAATEAAAAAAVSRLAALHLEQYPWLEPALKADADVIILDLGANKTIELELTTDNIAPKESVDAVCSRAVDGAGGGGACVYLTRCASATNNITIQEYTLSYCTINNKYAGVCCPKTKVDVPSN